uniref:ZP domain-containing protein n=1 Tax=Plectus sambesii TaxID=2011161 RepID=A0A914W5N1_9BILA
MVECPRRQWLLFIFAFYLAGLSSYASANSIANKMTGPPVVTCGPDRIDIHASTEAPFEGVVFIKNWRRTDGCFQSYDGENNRTSSPGHSIPLSDLARCGLQMRRNPESKELEIFSVFVFSFHPNFVTMGDRAFAIHCIFRQRDITVATKFDFISDISTRGILSGTASMPSVSLKIVSGRVPDPAVEAASTVRVGDPIMFIWYLPIASDVYGVRVRDCNAETMQGRRFKILDNGCTADDATMSDVTYSDDMSKAYSDAMAFKFPDAEDLWFKCTVAVCMKRMGDSEKGVSADTCQTVSTCSQRVRRDTDDTRSHPPVDPGVDETAVDQRLYIIDSFSSNRIAPSARSHPPVDPGVDETAVDQRLYIIDSFSSNRIAPSAMGVSFHNRTATPHRPAVQRRRSVNSGGWQVCMRRSVFALLSSTLILLYSVTFIVVVVAAAIYINGRRHGDAIDHKSYETEVNQILVTFDDIGEFAVG